MSDSQQGGDRQGNRAFGYGIECRKVSLVDLLHPALVVKFNIVNDSLCLEIGRWIIETHVTVFTYTHDTHLWGILGQQVGITLHF